MEKIKGRSADKTTESSIAYIHTENEATHLCAWESSLDSEDDTSELHEEYYAVDASRTESIMTKLGDEWPDVKIIASTENACYYTEEEE